MPKAKAIASLSGMIDSDSEERSDVEMMPTPDSNQENAQPVKKAPGRPKAAAPKARKVKAASRRLSGGLKPKTASKKKVPAKRAPLKEQANDQQQEETEEVENIEDEIPSVAELTQADASQGEQDELVQPKKQPLKRGRVAGTGKKAIPVAKKEIAEQINAVEKDGEFEYTPTAARQDKLLARVSIQHPRSVEPIVSQQFIPETQPTPLNTDEFDLPKDDDELDEAIPQSVYRKTNHARANSNQRQPAVARRRAGSASDTERGGNDSGLRRKLGEMTKKFESLEMKYQNLREVGTKEAESNFEKLKKQSEDRTKIANDLIASLKKELVTQKTLAGNTKSLQSILTTSESSLASAQTQIAKLTSSLTDTQNENKALRAKLAASRNASQSIESTSAAHAKTPGSAIKGKNHVGTRTVMVGSIEAAQAAQVAQLKEELYADLTGLLLRGVDRQEEADVYDCIQTGRNGTLHFKLAVATDSSPTNSYEDTEFQYTPRLDSNRDRDLLDILPDYLTDEITFSRQHAAKFYSRVVDTLTRKIED